MSRYASCMNCASRILTICLAIGILLAASPSLAKSKPKKPKPINPQIAKLEVKLMKKLIDIDYAGLKLAKAADLKTTSVEVLAFNQEFEARKQQEVTTLQTWLKEWYKITYIPKKATIRAEMEFDNGDEEGDGEVMSFEEIYLEGMIGVLHRDIAHAKQAPRKGGHPEFKAFASSLVSADREGLLILKEIEAALEAADEQTDVPESA